MKNKILSALLIALFTFSIVGVPSASAVGNNEHVEACKNFQDANPVFFDLIFKNFGDCANNTLNKAINNYCEDNSDLPFFNGPYKNKGQCVSDLQHIFS